MGDWSTGLPQLAEGSDAALRDAAKQDLSTSADDAGKQVTAGDAWWQLGRSAGGDDRRGAMLRAAHWYERAQAQLAPGLTKTRLQRRLEQIREEHSSQATSLAPFGRSQDGGTSSTLWNDVL